MQLGVASVNNEGGGSRVSQQKISDSKTHLAPMKQKGIRKENWAKRASDCVADLIKFSCPKTLSSRAKIPSYRNLVLQKKAKPENSCCAHSLSDFLCEEHGLDRKWQILKLWQLQASSS